MHGTSSLKNVSSGKGLPKEFVRRPTRPGEVLRDEFLRDHGITQDEFADAIGMSRRTVNQLINGKRSITAETAIRLAKATSTSATLWLDLQRNLDLFEAHKKIGDALRNVKVVLAPTRKSKVFFDLPT
jgi:addiction module HigA family antidote